MRFFARFISGFCCSALLLAAASTADAATINGEFWSSSASGLTATGPSSSVPVAGSAVYSTAATASFTASNATAADVFSFNLGGTGYSGDSNLYTFLTAGGDSVTGISSVSAPGTDNIDQGLFQFTGSTTLTNGIYDFTHDDGMLLYLSGIGSPVINSAGEVYEGYNQFCVGSGVGCVAAGTYSFTLDYAEVNGAPATLQGNLPVGSPTPEPSSIFMLGTGLVGLAGMMRRRLVA